MEPEPKPWRPGDRVRVRLPDHQGVRGYRGRMAWFSGTVCETDPPGQRPGVVVELDWPVNGVRTCFATHGELRPEVDSGA